MTEHPWRVRPLAAEYVHSLAECHIACWREAYRGLVPVHVLDAFDIERRAELGERDRVRYPGRTHVAVVEDLVIGFSSAGPPDDADAVTPLELHALYVRSRWHGSGVADDLIRAALDPAAPCSLWVFERNARAQAFYRKHGFVLDGTRKVEPFTAAMEVRMVRTPSRRRPPTDVSYRAR
ncbi:GNAT family N-acetyltransferase [Nocardia gamkensis]|uniref:GNAT family N-acetyltransferase n=1 Tax=Nocardia gamkensis TaxID=352869 RepID=A0A7X6R2G4_9NOCA|nr:GNAT family N-acetyltransferase [Nocardia gamkensis]NKY26364.1 GNAT family N-acetyltransferase [Nocardia gamkensis]NQE67808.1 2-(1,2-epoxy-1,2-dihydrophenyl)acetyl-CoA isomerase [Nocardia gamkensis]